MEKWAFTDFAFWLNLIFALLGAAATTIELWLSLPLITQYPQVVAFLTSALAAVNLFLQFRRRPRTLTFKRPE